MGFGFPIADELGFEADEVALFEYFLRIGFLRRKLKEEFESAFDAWKELSQIEEAVANEWREMGESGTHLEPASPSEGRLFPSIVMDVIYTPGLYAGELREEAALLRSESSAGSLILMLDDVFQRLRREVLDAAGKPNASEFSLCKIAGGVTHVTTLTYAAGNAYRHAKDWLGLLDPNLAVNREHRQYSQSKSTLRILDSSVGLDTVVDGNVCIATLSLMSIDTSNVPRFETLLDRLDQVGIEFAQRFGSNEDSYDKVIEGLELQESYNSVGTSFSMDERLFRRDLDTDSEL